MLTNSGPEGKPAPRRSLCAPFNSIRNPPTSPISANADACSSISETVLENSMKSILLAMILASTANGAHAQSTTVGEIIPHCENFLAVGNNGGNYNDEALIHAMTCMGTVNGVATVLEYNCATVMKGISNPNPRFSSEMGPTRGAQTQAFVNWARAHPEHWDLPAAEGIMFAIPETFPCKAFAE